MGCASMGSESSCQGSEEREPIPNLRRHCLHLAQRLHIPRKRGHANVDARKRGHPRRLCAKREVARAADAIGAWQTSSYGRGVDWGQQRPPQPRRKAPRDEPESSPGQALGTAPQARLKHRRERLRPLWRHATDRGQHRRTHRHPRHPWPLRKARRAGESALPTRPARTACCSRVTPRRPRRRRRNQEDNTERPRSRREALGPLPEIGEK